MSGTQVLFTLITIIVVIAGWFVGSSLRNNADIKGKRRTVIIEHLINAYSVLSAWVYSAKLSNEEKSKIESVISDIQLLGSMKVLDALNEFLEAWEEGKSADIGSMLGILRSELRNELKLDKDSSKTKFFRF